MKAEKVRDLDNAELQNQLGEIREQVYRLRLQILMGQTAGLKKYRALRKDKARVLTVLRERELVSQAGKG
jgi:large subunit ribosomal protein L29